MGILSRKWGDGMVIDKMGRAILKGRWNSAVLAQLLTF